MPRPRKNAKSRRNRHVIFRLTDEEYDALCATAERAGLSPNELGRRIVRKRHHRVVVHTYRHYDPAFLKRIDHIGHNLNQLVKNAHIFGRVSPRIEQLCETIDRLVSQAIEDSIDDP
jgi:hypothetical protein